MARNLRSLVAGIVIAFATVWIVEMVGHFFYPLPSDLSLENRDQIGSYVQKMPIGAQIFVLAAWFLGALTGGITAMRLGGARWTLWLIGLLVVLGGVATIFWIPHPELLQIMAVVAPMVGVLIASHFAASVSRPDAFTDDAATDA